MPSPRILFVTGEYPPMQGGVADYTRALSRALVALDAEIAVLTSTDAGGSPADPGVTVLARVEQWGRELWSALDLAVREWRPDIVHIQYQTAAYDMNPAINLWPWRPWRKPGLPTAVTFHDLRQPYLFPKAHSVRRWVTRTLAQTTTLAITTNPEDTLALRPYRPNVVEIPIGSNIPCAPPPHFDRDAYRARLGLPPNSLLLSYFGFLNASKGGEALADVLAALVEKGMDAHLLMIGGRVGASDPTNYTYLQQVEAHIVQLGLSPRVHWTGHIPEEEVSAAFLASHLCLLPYLDGASYRRGSFMAALEHGLPIVTTTPAVPYPDLIDGETVLLAPPGDIRALTAAAERALANPELRERLGANAGKLARRFRWDQIARQSLDAYRSALPAG